MSVRGVGAFSALVGELTGERVGGRLQEGNIVRNDQKAKKDGTSEGTVVSEGRQSL
jgi:hypothetical protein